MTRESLDGMVLSRRFICSDRCCLMVAVLDTHAGVYPLGVDLLLPASARSQRFLAGVCVDPVTWTELLTSSN